MRLRRSHSLSRTLALTGAAALVLSPFSYVPYILRLLIALLFGVVASHRLQGISAPTEDSPNQVIPKGWLPRRIGMAFLLLMIYAVICSLVSINVLMGHSGTNFGQVLQRSLTQLGSLSFFMFEAICGFHMALWLKPSQLRPLLVYPMLMTLLIALYQSTAIATGLPYIGRYAFDALVGLRPSGLAMEPKYLSSYLAIGATFLIVDFIKNRRQLSKALSFTYLAMSATSAYYFISAASGNGALTLVIIILTYLLAFPTKKKMLFLVLMMAAIVSAYQAIDFDQLPIRSSHKGILENLSALDILMFDDLIFLPALAWMENISSVIFGFGPGLMHFFGAKYAAYATWLTDETYIEGNLSAIMFISNFGLITFALLFIAMLRNSLHTIKRSRSKTWLPFDVWFLLIFMSGAFVSGNISTPIYLSIGWALARSHSLRAHRPTARQPTH